MKTTALTALLLGTLMCLAGCLDKAPAPRDALQAAELTPASDAAAPDEGLDSGQTGDVPETEGDLKGQDAAKGPDSTDALDAEELQEEAPPLLTGELLGRPTDHSIALNLLPEKALDLSVLYGKTGGALTGSTQALGCQAEAPCLVTLDGLAQDTRYYYRLRWRLSGDQGFKAGPERSFHTWRPAGKTFVFTVQADPHMDENSDIDVYRTTLANVLADTPDFHIDLGDTFMCEKHNQPFVADIVAAASQAEVDARYLFERGNFGLITPSVPLFLVNGNHEGEAGWLLNGTAENLGVWATLARQRFFLNPPPDEFYKGDQTEEQFVGRRAAWYSWEWGNALFVVLDPYWNTMKRFNKDGWLVTLGQQQFEWLHSTLSSSKATFKLVFIHSLVGGLDGQLRGGIEAAPFFEWGGKNLDGTEAFAQQRPGWSMPIHELLLSDGVDVVFHGHDHLYVKQDLDGIVYQEVPMPSASNSTNGPAQAANYHYETGTVVSNSGHLRVTVAPEKLTVEYVRAWTAKSETAGKHNRDVDDTWEILAH